MNQEINNRDIWEDKKYYIYRLIDPRNGLPFYIGVGYDDLAKKHALGQWIIENYDYDKDLRKFKSIKEIIDAGYKINYIIDKQDLNMKETIIEVYRMKDTFKEINKDSQAK